MNVYEFSTYIPKYTRLSRLEVASRQSEYARVIRYLSDQRTICVAVILKYVENNIKCVDFINKMLR